MRKLPPGSLAVGAMLAVAIVFAGLGGYYLLAQERGTPSRATVTDCHDSTTFTGNGTRTTTTCTGYWVLGGPLGDGGRKVFGEVRGAGWSKLNETVSVRIYHGRAYTTGMFLAIGFFGISGFFFLAAIGLFFLVRRLAPTAPAQALSG